MGVRRMIRILNSYKLDRKPDFSVIVVSKVSNTRKKRLEKKRRILMRTIPNTQEAIYQNVQEMGAHINELEEKIDFLTDFIITQQRYPIFI